MDKKDNVEKKPEPTEKQKQEVYTVRLAGGFILDVQAKSPDHAEGLAVGQVSAKIPGFIINNVQVEKKK